MERIKTVSGKLADRNAVLETISDIIVWSNLQAKALFSRVFILTACLILLYFLLRLVYRYMRARDSFTLSDVLQTVMLLIVVAIPIMLIGVFFIEYTEPDMGRIEHIREEVKTAVAELAEE